ncbi:acyl carrier protein [Aromatoleum bremense]|uniref:Acyl carrier protein n=1 Tax=Aromatoleum bremense TaxID=76115 RepID=A0ABX1NX18_9RHOO|nr:phosphopantetheine-binding protein [Aromatoleum bremense]NMG16554.1 acyl carrier protein [Aromatoleum bremense]QTQ32815.1 Acyl carrier protein [Aromatoleum bremense]
METGVDFSKAVKRYILEEFLPGENPDELTEDLPLISGGILDSIATLKLVLHFEEQYGIVIEAHEADKEHLDTIRSIASLLASKVR